MTDPALPAAVESRLERRLGFLQATALNMTNMIGIGPFITIPILMGTLNKGGPQAMLGWLFVFVTNDKKPLLIGLGTLAAGVICFLAWSGINRRWPFAASKASVGV